MHSRGDERRAVQGYVTPGRYAIKGFFGLILAQLGLRIHFMIPPNALFSLHNSWVGL